MEHREVWRSMGGKGADGKVIAVEGDAFSVATYADTDATLYVEYDTEIRKGVSARVVRLSLSALDPGGDLAAALIDRFGEPSAGREGLAGALRTGVATWSDEACGLRVTAGRQRSAWWAEGRETFDVRLEPIAPNGETAVNGSTEDPRGDSAETQFDRVASSTVKVVPQRTVAAAGPATHVARQQISPVAVADLALDLAVDDATPDVGSELALKLTVQNAGPSDATGVAIRVALPSGLRIMEADGSTNFDVERQLWSVDRLPAGAQAGLSLLARVEPRGPYDVAAEIVAAEQKDPDSSPDNGVATEDDSAARRVVPVPVADLSLTQRFDDVAAIVQTEVRMTLTIDNSGPSDASGVVVTSVLPDGLRYLGDDGEGAYSPRGGKWKVGEVPAGSSRSLIITARVDPRGTYRAVAEISAAGERDPDSVPGNRLPGEDDASELELAPIAIAELSLTQRVDNATPDVGAEVAFELRLQNAGPSDATGVVVHDRLPSGYLYVAHRGDGAYDDVSGVWRVDTLAAGVSAVLTLRARVNPTGDYDNIATIAACDQPGPVAVTGASATTLGGSLGGTRD